VASKLTRTDVAKIAELARLELTPRELDLFSTQLTAILDYAAVIEQVETSSVAQASSVAPGGNAGVDPVEAAFLRADSPTPSIRRDQVLSQAPDAAPDAGLFRVPKVL
jgi:aspartyl-tRNA(Asn)/glutamyl-tRNA(Gln) amidotransferase subunit C